MLKIFVSSLIADLAATLLVPLCNRLTVKDETPELSFNKETAPPSTPVDDEGNKPAE